MKIGMMREVEERGVNNELGERMDGWKTEMEERRSGEWSRWKNEE